MYFWIENEINNIKKNNENHHPNKKQNEKK